MFIAHIKKNEDSEYQTQSMDEHLYGTALLASKFSVTFHNPEWGRLLGLWHDLGKFSKDFQEYIKINSGYEENDQKRPKTDHTSAGAIFAKETFPKLWPPFAYCIAGHHAGLHNWQEELGIPGDLNSRLKKLELFDKIKNIIPSEIKKIKDLNAPTGKPLHPEQIHLWIRMLFSCLVDADYLDTERFMNPESFEKRGNYKSIQDLKHLFDLYMAGLINKVQDSDINRIRNQILEECVRSGEKEPGFFSITVPTGGGKTLSSMAWALGHAIKYNKDRIVFAIPYTSIIIQTAEIYRNIFGENNVTEHHCNVDEDADSQERKLATENWDAPVVVTTNVQLFESLFANKTSKCRKLHNLVNSVIILDEAQMLPPEFLKPILSVLKGLVENFGVSVLFSTATQPVLAGTIGGSGQNSFIGIDSNSVREIVTNKELLSKELKRVEIKLPENEPQIEDWPQIAEELSEYEQVLCIVNTRKDCRELYNLMTKDTIHLSRMMCSAHIMDTIKVIKEKLQYNESIRVISTQLIEAGVDIDFPVVYRAMAGLDSVAQSAGRCNREGKLNKEGKLGLIRVFYPVNNIPPGLMRKGADALTEILGESVPTDLLSPQIFQKYFSLFYSKVQNFDKPKIHHLLWQDAAQMKFQFATTARDFKLIDDRGMQNILIEYKEGSNLIGILKQKGPETWLMRKLQRYSVSVNKRDFEDIKKAGLIEQIHGCWIQADEKLYNSKTGLINNGEWLEEIHII